MYVGATNLYRWNGATWASVSAGITDLRAIWGSSATDVWVGGAGGSMVHYNGTSWSAPITLGSSDVGGIWGTSSSDVYMVNRGGDIWHYNGLSWVKYTIAGDAFLGVWGSSKTDVWVVGADNSFTFNRVFQGTR